MPTMTLDDALALAVGRFEAGALHEADHICRQVEAQGPGLAGASHLRGLIAHRQGHFAQAVLLLQKAAELDGGAASTLVNLAISLTAAGRHDAAAAACRQALAAEADHPRALAQLGAVLLRLGDHAGARRNLERAVELAPNEAGTWANLGTACVRDHDAEAAATAFARAVELAPDDPDLHVGLADTARLRGDLELAADHLEKALSLSPDSPTICCALGQVRRDKGNANEAIRLFGQAIRLDPGQLDAHKSLGMVLNERGQWDEARAVITHARSLAPADPDVAVLESALLERCGEAQQAWTTLEPLVAGGLPSANAAVVYARLAPKVGRVDVAAEALLDLWRSSALARGDRVVVGFALGDLLDRLDRCDEAFTIYAEANRLKPVRFSPDRLDARFAAQCQVFASGLVGIEVPDCPEQEPDRRPVFIVGMPRSGTSLVEQVLAAHPDVIALGERNDVQVIAHDLPAWCGGDEPYPACLPGLNADALGELRQRCRQMLDRLAPGAKRVTNKTPTNFEHLGLIALLMPGARVIHCTRDPRDVGLSCYFLNFVGAHPWAYDLRHIAHLHRRHVEIMRHWRQVLALPIHELSYESLVEDPEAEVRSLLDFVGLPWASQCLRFHEQKRYVATASYDQVRQPIYRSSVGRWRRYERHLQPLFDALASGD
jgi:Flp pilus assembly protein TadD